MASLSDTDVSQKEKITHFVTVTGVDIDRALFYLQAAAWNLDAALSSFFDNSEPSQSDPAVPVQETQKPNPAAVPSGPEPTSSETEFSHQKPGKVKSGVATLSDYRDKSQTATPPEDKGQEFFAGGSEHSGQMIEGPPRKKVTPSSMAKDVFESAKKHGAVSVEEEEKVREKPQSAAFIGSGFKLGDSEGPSVQITGEQKKSTKKIHHTLTFWKDGFSVDDGDLRSGESEEDKRFIQSVSKGELPQELVHSAKGGEIDIDIQDNRTETYVRSKPKLVAFSGEGRKLGGLAPVLVGEETTPTGDTPPPTVPMDPSQPSTSVQIRLADGSRLAAKFNHSHTVNDIRQFINLSRPAFASSVYFLLTTFPNRELSDPTQTLSDANLLNAVIVQRMK